MSVITATGPVSAGLVMLGPRRARGSKASASVGGDDRGGELAQQAPHAPADVLADASHAVEVGVGGVCDLPVLVALAGIDQVRVTAAHRGHRVDRLDDLAGQALRGTHA